MQNRYGSLWEAQAQPNGTHCSLCVTLNKLVQHSIELIEAATTSQPEYTYVLAQSNAPLKVSSGRVGLEED
jgi:hypothetical protein